MADAVESSNCQLRQAAKNRLSFPADDAVFKILYLAVRNASKKVGYAYTELGAGVKPVCY